ncbi:MAG: VCBS repeat-containing protein [Dyadobacter sp.]|uniref:FG-GAP repeat domain-containing protein n=1 Tax=Dyadobacter sp. TaxID=1914288 RepID=UPI001B0F1606|nr:VCBS repeat-containing protein [Dyadobacter sp.]MBO9615991.1 VCBS repeat-containing protein [Dyadobacter sp.]
MILIKKALLISVPIGMAGLSLSFQEKLPASEAAGHRLQADSVQQGRKLAMDYCQRCHLFPDPSLLDKKTWVTSVLPNMGLRLGIRPNGQDPYADLIPEEKHVMQALNVYPEAQLISEGEWKEIVAYYRSMAPAVPLPQEKTLPVEDSLRLFHVSDLTVGDKEVPKTSMLKYDPASSLLYIGDDQNALYVFGKTGLKDTWWIDSAPTDIDFPQNAPPRLLSIGVFKPSDQRTGRLMSLSKTTDPSLVNVQNLPRPVQFATGDLNMDGKDDALICGFGNHSGKLFWLDNFQQDKEHILKELPGARKAEIRDLNGDKKPDIIALLAQAWEQVTVFYNLGNGKFKEKTVLQFPPSYGMSYMEMVDFNKDGFQDIVLTNGDNWDLSPIDKNYHGVRLYLNDGKDNFKLAWFFPLYGASKAVARDFDLDGDIDIAATAFYSDLANPAHSFIYLSNEGKMNFKAFSTPMAAAGKWLTMEAADFDQDGDTDIVLGSYFHTIGEMTKLISRGQLSFPQLLVLTNRRR